MKLLHVRPPSRKRPRVDTKTGATARRRLRALELVDKMVDGGMRRGDALCAIRLPKSTYYDWRKAFRRGGVRALEPRSTRPRTVRRRRWTDPDVRAVLGMRARYPFMGKVRLKAMLDRRGVRLSVSTVGRIIEEAIADGRTRRASFCEGRPKPARRRTFDGAWARRWSHGDSARAPGELVQVDHMTYSRDGRVLKEFRAVCPTTRHMVARVFSRATAGNAGRFLAAVVENMPFPVASIQVDGGAEFRADFERACEARRIPLHVLPPRRPQLNGHVERANRSARIEFWNLYDGPLTVADVTPRLAGYEFFHNYERPHLALDCRTPNEYLVELEEAA